MQSLDDDMDELFRRAADEYPLNTKGADWSKVMQNLHGPELDAHNKNKKKNDYRFLLLLLLLPIGFVCGRYVGSNSKGTGPSSRKTEEKKIAASSVQQNNAGKIDTATQVNLTGNGPLSASENAGENSRSGKNTKDTDQFLARRKNQPVAKPAVEKSPSPLAADQSGAVYSKTGKSAGDYKPFKKATKETNPGEVQSRDGKKNANPDNGKQPIADNIKSPETALPADTTISTAITGKSIDTTTKATAIATVNKKAKNQESPFKKSFFYSLVAGPDLSAMKLDRTHQLGFSIGVLVGYQVSKRLSVQTGALWDRKSYYAKGKYFDTSYLKLPMHSKVQDATGHCNMIEIPINVKYDFVSKPKHAWFVSAGLSSYLMKKEDYKINYTRYNQMYDKDYDFNNSTKNWFSIMNVSAGYQQSLGRYTSFSVAPYFKVPLRGVGIAKLPISSAGVYLTVSRSLRK